MSKAKEYYDLVRGFILYEHDDTIEALLTDFVATLCAAGVRPRDAAQYLYDTLTGAMKKP